jgi:hypothetical protein
MTDNITLPRAVVEQVREALKELDYASEPYVNQIARTALAALDAALEAQEDEALLNEPVAMRYDGDGYGYLYIDSGSGSDWQRRHKDAEPLYLAPPQPDAITRAVEAAVKECVTICERQRAKILKNPADPSWTEHLAEVQEAMKQRFGVDMGYPALAEPEKKRAETGIPARGEIEVSTGEAYPTPQPDAKREPATVEQVIAASGPWWGPSATADFFTGFRAAERHYGITKEDKT